MKLGHATAMCAAQDAWVRLATARRSKYRTREQHRKRLHFEWNHSTGLVTSHRPQPPRLRSLPGRSTEDISVLFRRLENKRLSHRILVPCWRSLPGFQPKEALLHHQILR